MIKKADKHLINLMLKPTEQRDKTPFSDITLHELQDHAKTNKLISSLEGWTAGTDLVKQSQAAKKLKL